MWTERVGRQEGPHTGCFERTGHHPSSSVVSAEPSLDGVRVVFWIDSKRGRLLHVGFCLWWLQRERLEGSGLTPAIVRLGRTGES